MGISNIEWDIISSINGNSMDIPIFADEIAIMILDGIYGKLFVKIIDTQKWMVKSVK